MALLIAAFGLGALLQLFVQAARAAHRDSVRAQAIAAGQGIIAELQTLPRPLALARIAQAPEMVSRETSPEFTLRWSWSGELAAGASVPLELQISPQGASPDVVVTLPVTL